MAISFPAATTGLEQQCRDFARLLKGQANYEAADGIDLMVDRGGVAPLDPSTAQPDLKITAGPAGDVTIEWRKSGFDALDLQYRKAGETMWQAADKSTEKTMDFMPAMTTPGTPEKFEFRGVYLMKNQRVGQWSAIFSVTVG